MAGLNVIARVFDELRRDLASKSRRAFLNDVEGQIEEDDELQEILTQHRKSRYLAITFDRRKNDPHFSYGDFDLLLVVLDALSGGNGIYKPSNQIRALRWMGNEQQLLATTLYFGRTNPQLRYWRAMVLPFPGRIVGHRIDRRVYRKNDRT